MSDMIDIGGFEQRYRDEPDPWGVFTRADEHAKRAAIIKGVDRGDSSSILELGSGIGGHSSALAAISIHLDCVEATPTGAERTRERLANHKHAHVHQITLPGSLPRPSYTTIVIAELLYYLSVAEMASLADDVAAALAPEGQLVLAHHWSDFRDAKQSGATIHRDFARFCKLCHSQPQLISRTAHWRVERFTRSPNL